jgi:hypothetical protein
MPAISDEIASANVMCCIEQWTQCISKCCLSCMTWQGQTTKIYPHPIVLWTIVWSSARNIPSKFLQGSFRPFRSFKTRHVGKQIVISAQKRFHQCVDDLFDCPSHSTLHLLKIIFHNLLNSWSHLFPELVIHDLLEDSPLRAIKSWSVITDTFPVWFDLSFHQV